MMVRRLSVALCALLLTACAGADFSDSSDDSDANRGTRPDVSTSRDVGSAPDTGAPQDTGTTTDAGDPDSGLPDAGLPDATDPDAGLPDASVPDAGLPDTGDPDAGLPDTDLPDVDLPDTDDSGPDAPADPERCDNGVDDDGDGLRDCDDPDCDDALECAPFCGDGVINGAEECDGDSAGCAPGEDCSDTCACIPIVTTCGDGVAEGIEECDGLDDAACGAGWVCDGACACDGPPRLFDFAAPVLGGDDAVVVVAPNRSGGVCPEFAAPHGLQVRLVGESTEDIVTVEVQRAGVDPTPLAVDLAAAPIAAGVFDTRTDLCLPTLEEGVVHQVTLVDARGRRSTTRSFTLPTLSAPTLTTLRLFLSRDLGAHVLQISGLSPDANIATLISDIETSTGMLADFETPGWPVLAAYRDGQFWGGTVINGLLEIPFTVDRYTSRLVTYGGLQSSTLSAVAPTSVARTGSSCVPTRVGSPPTCTASSWCVPGAVFNEGVCGAAVTAPPTLTGASFAAFVLNSANCEPEFPNELTFELSGTSTIPITSITLAIPGVIEPAAELGTAPIVESPFRETLGLCFNGPLSGELIQTAVIDEAGRASGTLSFFVE